ncbi:aspartyl-phosphate phosphatase Spo0E family protein [Gorillibacterium massiliense]|uniref:aspartyl-phosphate phosphatase Spo0E family protein n=1 Tax=Gorillibacterium massiliense TaxID=1280390 RepID=UPI0004B81894|nr:aspartyl-phosphate phosphatase Spo0E family protein [Gorillibacterium massiliense]
MLYKGGIAVTSDGTFVIRESGSGIFGKSYLPSPTSSLYFLEEEIRILRLRMEELVEREKSLTAPRVVEASSKLDIKINEYMYTIGSC